MTLLDAFETSKMTMLKFDTLPGTDVLTYLAERATYSEQMVAEITAQVLDALSYIHWRGKVSEKAESDSNLPASITQRHGSSRAEKKSLHVVGRYLFLPFLY